MIDPSHLDDAGNAALMVMLLEDDQAAQILSRLEPEELRVLGERMCALGEIGPEAIANAIAGFIDRTERLGLTTHDRVGQFRSLMTKAVGEIKADNLMQQILPEHSRPSSLDVARWLTPQALIPMIKDEHPQTLALLLAQLDPAVAGEVLHRLPSDIQSEVVHRVATLGPVSRDALSMLEELLTLRIEQCHGKAMLAVGGPREAAEIINNSGRAMERRVMPEINRIDKALAKLIENEMFRFEDLFELDPQAMGFLLREIDSETLIDALKGLAEDERKHFFGAMSSRAAEGVQDEIEARGRVKLDDVAAAQKRIVDRARKLAAEGVIVFGSGDGEYV